MKYILHIEVMYSYFVWQLFSSMKIINYFFSFRGVYKSLCVVEYLYNINTFLRMTVRNIFGGCMNADFMIYLLDWRIVFYCISSFDFLILMYNKSSKFNGVLLYDFIKEIWISNCIAYRYMYMWCKNYSFCLSI